MRYRYDENGEIIGSHSMVFDSIPDDYQVESIFVFDDMFPDLSYLGILGHLKEYYSQRNLTEYELGVEFRDDEWFRQELFENMALDYLYSARFLWQRINAERNQDVVSRYLIPCTFLCKHAMELYIKRCLLSKGIKRFRSHSVKKLWEMLDAESIPDYNRLTAFVEEVEKVDCSEMALRYGLGNDLNLISSNLHYDIDRLLTNAMYMFNVLNKHVLYTI